MPILIDIEGPAFSQISFAHVVRSLAFALEDLGCLVSLQATDINSQGYKTVASERNYDRLVTMTNRKPAGIYKLLYNFPVSMRNRCTGYNFAIISWETTKAPAEWIQDLNRYADQTWSISSFVQEAFLTGGLQKNKARILPMGVDPSLYSPKTPKIDLGINKSFKFLHLGVAQARKGTDILIRAFNRAFRKEDDVSLIIKSNGFGRIDQWIQAGRTETSPEIKYIYEECHEDKLPGYYAACDCFVYPVHAEGAGLPVLESLACGKTVIVPNWSGLIDFCNGNNSFFVKHKIAPLKTPYSSYSGAGVESWADVSEDDLVEQLKHVVKNPLLVKQKGEYAGSYVSTKFSWRQTALSALKHIAEATKNLEITTFIKNKETVAIQTVIETKTQPILRKSSQKIGILSSFSIPSEASYYAKTCIQHSSSLCVGLSSRDTTDARLISFFETGMASPSSIIDLCKKEMIDILQIHWDKFVTPSHALPGLMRTIHEAGIPTILFFHDELPDVLPYDFFYLSPGYFTNSIKIRNQLLDRGCPLDRLKYLPPIRQAILQNNRDKLRVNFNIGSSNFVFMSPVVLDERTSCIPTMSQEFPPHCKYIIAVAKGNPQSIDKHIEIAKKLNQFVTIVPPPISNNRWEELLSMADCFVMPYQNISDASKNPMLAPVIGRGKPVVVDRDVLCSEIENMYLLNAQPLSDISTIAFKDKDSLIEPQTLIKSLESLYYNIGKTGHVRQKPQAEQITTKTIFSIDAPVFFSEL